MSRAVTAGLLYFAAVFALGFLLGVIRVTLLVPRLGEATAVSIELPLMLLAAWVICGAVLRRRTVSPEIGARMAMAATYLALLLVAETLVGGLTGRSLAGAPGNWPGLLGLAAQLLTAAFPLLRRAR